MKEKLSALVIFCLIILIAVVPVPGLAGSSPTETGSNATVTITNPVILKYHIGEDTITFSGTNTASNTTYLILSGPNLDTNGSQLQTDWPRMYPVTDGDASTFTAVSAGPDTTWSFTWDTHDVAIDSGMYTLYAASTPRDIPHINSSHFGRISILMLPPKDRNMPMVKIAPPGNPRYHIGEDMITFSGINTASNTTYLILSGPNLDTNGSQLQKDRPREYPVSDGNASAFTAVSVGPDSTWSFTWDMHNVAIDSGMYALYAASTPRDISHINSSHFARVTFIMLPPGDRNLPAVISTGSGDNVLGHPNQVPDIKNQSVDGQNKKNTNSGTLLDQIWRFLSGTS